MMLRVCTALVLLVSVGVRPGPAQSAGQHYDGLVRQAKASLAEKRPVDAAKEAESAIKLEPARWEAYVLLASATSDQERYDDAISHLKMALQRAPEAKKNGIRSAIAELETRIRSMEPPASGGPRPAKLAVVNLQAAVFGTAETKKANDEMIAKFKPRQDVIDQLNREIQALASQLQTSQGRLTGQAYAEVTAEGQTKQRELQRAQDALQADATAYRNEVLQKMSQKMVEVIKKLAADRGFDLVVEANSAVSFKSAFDITKDAVAEYDRAYPVK